MRRGAQNRAQNASQIEPNTPPRGPQKARKTAPNEQPILSGFQERFPACSSHPKSLLNRPSRPRAPRGLPKGRPRLAQEPPKRLSADVRLILKPCWPLPMPIWASCGDPGFHLRASGWSSLACLRSLLSFELRLDATTPPNPLTTTPLNHNASKKGGRRHGGGALKIYFCALCMMKWPTSAVRIIKA